LSIRGAPTVVNPYSIVGSATAAPAGAAVAEPTMEYGFTTVGAPLIDNAIRSCT